MTTSTLDSSNDQSSAPARSWLSRVPTASRLLLGLMFSVFGANFFLQFLPVPPPSNATAQAFMGGLFQSGYFFPFMKGVEMVTGIALLTGYFAPLALVILAPIVLNISLYHRFLDPSSPMDLVLVALMLIAAWGYRDVYRPFFQLKR